MYEAIDSTVTVTGRPLSEWVGDVLRGNAIALAERGAGGGYMWSAQSVLGLIAQQQSDPSPISTHPDYWYSVPFTMAASAYQSELEVEIAISVSGGVDLALWCEGVASTPIIGATTGVQTLNVPIPPRLQGDMRCALLIRSQVGAELDSGHITYATNRYMHSTTNQCVNPEQAQHLFIELSGTAVPMRGWQGTTRYHVIRGELKSSRDEFETWPAPDDSLQSVVAYTADVKVYALGKIVLYSLQARLVSGVATGLPYIVQNNAGQPVRASWMQRIARYYAGEYQTSMQYAWIGGVGGVPRSTGTTGVGVTPIGLRLWGAWVPRNNNVVALNTAIRARDGVDGMVLTVLYAANAPVGIEIEYDGTTTQTVVLPESRQGTTKRDTFSSEGTLSWRHGPLTRDQCSSQDIGLHGVLAAGMDCDTARFGMAAIQLLWDGVISPSVGDIVRVKITMDADDKAYIASMSLRELTNLRALPQLTVPVIAPLQSIETVSWDRLRQRMEQVYETRLRCLYSERNDDGTGLIRVQNGQSGIVGNIAYTTSPDLPPGTVLRFTVDAQCLTAGTLDVSLTDGVTTLTLTFGARSTQTADLAITSNTAYTLSLAVAVSAVNSDGRVYLIRIEEYLP